MQNKRKGRKSRHNPYAKVKGNERKREFAGQARKMTEDKKKKIREVVIDVEAEYIYISVHL